MSDFYEEMQSVASSVLSDFAQGAVQYVEMTPGAGPPDDPGPASETLHSINAAVRGVSFKYIDGANVLSSDLQLTMPGDGVEPTMSGFIRVDGKSYKIVAIIRKPAAGTVVAWAVIFRK